MKYPGLGGRPARSRIDSPSSLAEFIDSRASHVAQTALYGYLKTRAGTRFRELFESDEFLVSINIAKWQVWVAAVADWRCLPAAALADRTGADNAAVAALMEGLVAEIFDRQGRPDDAGPEFEHSTAEVVELVRDSDFTAIGDDESAFVQSPEALVRWAPVVDELKQLDAEIVRNSVRFRWIEVRRDLREMLDAAAVMACARKPGGR
ncbi:MAG: esterase [Gammaproteobacteria bacterium]|nr:esterase [Gammaproteobacteria bacterium]